jgi:hypothetical protein
VDCGVWTALGDGAGGFQAPNVVLNDLGYQAGGWRVDRHPRFLAVLTNSGFTDIVGFGDDGVWTALGSGDGTFQLPRFVLEDFGYQQGWRVGRHPRFVVPLTAGGNAGIVGFGDDAVYVALGDRQGGFTYATAPGFGDLCYQQGWRVEKHPRFVVPFATGGATDIVGFGDAGYGPRSATAAAFRH